MATYRTPGVYIEEISKLPFSQISNIPIEEGKFALCFEKAFKKGKEP